MREYMQAMAKVVDGSDPKALHKIGGAGFDPAFSMVYRNNSVCAYSEALAANYMSVENIVGEAYFNTFVIDYLKHFPSNERTLVGYGVKFINIVKTRLPDHKLPYLIDLARLDRAWTEAHLASDTEALKLEDLKAMAEAGTDLEQVCLTPNPGVHAVKLAWPVFEIWQNLRKEQSPQGTIKLKKRGQFALVWRYDNTVHYRELQKFEYRFLTALFNGKPLGTAMNRAITTQGANLTEADLANLLPNAVGADLFAQCP